MAVAFVQNITAWGAGAAGPQASGSFTPTAADTIVVASLDSSGSGKTLAYSGTVNIPSSKITLNDAANGNTVGMAEVLSATGGAQTVSVNSSPGGDTMCGYAIEYSGVVSTSYSSKEPAGTNAPTGNAVVVPVGSVLVAFCTIVSSFATSSLTGQANGGVTPTDRQTGVNLVKYTISEWVGTGGSITPTWACASTETFVVLQVLLSGASAATGAKTYTSIQNSYPSNKLLLPTSVALSQLGLQKIGGTPPPVTTVSLPLSLMFQARVVTPQAEELPPIPTPSLRSFLTGTQTVGQPWSSLFPSPKVYGQDPELPVLMGDTRLFFGRTVSVSVGQPWQLWNFPPIRLVDPENPPIPLDLRLFYGKSPTTTAGQPWYLWPQILRIEEASNPKLQRDGDLHLFRQSFQTVGQPLAMFASVQLRPQAEFNKPPVESTQLFYGRVQATTTPGQPWFMWKGYQAQFETEIYRQPEIPTLLLVYGRPQVIPPTPPTGLHQVNMSVSFGMGLNRMGTNI